MHSEERRVQLTGGSTLIISLPKWWLDAFKVKKGDSLIISEHPSGGLTIIPKDVRISDCEININEGSDVTNVLRELISFYLAGYNFIKINISTHNPEVLNTLKSSIRRLLAGAEVVDESYNRLVVELIPLFQNTSHLKSIERMGVISYYMLRDSLRAVETGDRELAREIINRDDEVDRFYYYFHRSVNNLLMPLAARLEKVSLNPHDAVSYVMAARSIERIADHATNIASMVVEEPLEGQKLEKIIKIGYDATELFRVAVDLLLNPSVKELECLLSDSEAMISDIQKAHSRLSRASSPPSERLLYYNIRRIIEYSMDICENALNIATPKPRFIHTGKDNV
ncbi:MAG: phosphate uptake regulator PhoU [Aigarchaeota archaeon]|nr:phosphate uptake regulator PhoU [Aigarchaeota archaeon]MDW8093016.1 phosphate uptake regulator PhoU [Nitrososphaerota archaeon]